MVMVAKVHRVWVIYRPQSIDQHAGKIEFTSWPGYRVFGLPADSEIEVFMQRGIVWVVDDDSSIR